MTAELPNPVPFDPRRATPEQWARYEAFRRRRHEESRPEEPFESDLRHQLWLRREDPYEIKHRLVSDDGREIVAAARLDVPRPGAPGYESNRGILGFDLYVLKEHRRRGVAGSYLAPLTELAAEHGCRVIGAEGEDEAGKQALTALGMEKKAEERLSRLDVARLDWELVERWSDEGRRRNPDLRLERHRGFPPRESWPEYTQALTELFNTIPWGEQEHGDIVFTPATLADSAEQLAEGGGTVLTILVRDPAGDLRGLTEAAFYDDQPEHAWQWLTAVHGSIQGRGVGRRIKAEMLLDLRRERPRLRWVLTGNASSNAPMLKINTELGFRTYRVTTSYQMPFEKFARVAGLGRGISAGPTGLHQK